MSQRKLEKNTRNDLLYINVFIDCILQEYEPVHDKVATRQSWEVDQLLESTQSGDTLRS